MVQEPLQPEEFIPGRTASSPDSSPDSSITEDEEASHGDEWISKSGLHWRGSNDQTLHFVRRALGAGRATLLYMPLRASSPSKSFTFTVTDEIVTHIVAMTNLQGRRTMEHWTDTDVQEMRGYIGLLILAGVYR